MSDIRIALKLGRFSLEYSGSLSFFERVIDPLLVGLAPYPGREPAALAAAARAAARGEAQARPEPEAAGFASPSPHAGASSPAAPSAAHTSASHAPASQGGGGAAQAPKVYRPTSPEFGAYIQKLGPEAGEPDRQVLAFAFYLWNYEKKDVVREREIEGCFRALGLEPPRNASALFQDLSERLRFLQAAGEPGQWTLTTKGANYVRTRLLGSL